MSRLLRHLRGNAIAYLALFIALGGSSYAALGDPIGGNQIKNHAIQPVKFDPHLIGGVVRVWAVVGADGRLLSGSPGAGSGYNGPGDPGTYGVVWPRRYTKLQRCAATATVITRPYVDGFADVEPAGDGAFVHTYDPQGQRAPRPFSVVIVC
ncbi:MAG: hypothetical protein DLM64_01430 [Solirubrobacterales bacterium]|nr:MAG: hypothetical protein DLM64_01430 [Solirubrobacterales bacterium]